MMPSTENVQDAAREFIRMGFRVVPVPIGKKGPVDKGWPGLWIAETEIGKYFDSVSNLGLLLGEPSGGLVDVDLDCLEALNVCDTFLPPTSAVHGRRSKLRSHRWYRTNSIPESKPYKDADTKMIVELRSTRLQTVVPPSVHPSGERYVWDERGEPAFVRKEDLERAVLLVAICAFLARNWPQVNGSRNELALATAGALLRAEFSTDEVEQVIREAAKVARDEEWQSRPLSVRDTLAKLEQNQEVTGFPRMEELLGTKVIDVLRDWVRSPTTSRSRSQKPSGQLVDLARREATLFRTPDGIPYADIKRNGHRETVAVESRAMKDWLTERSYRENRVVPTSGNLMDALNTLRGLACLGDQVRDVHIPVAAVNREVFLDLGVPIGRLFA